jgi:flavin-dependent dehydrogenase
MYIALEGNLPLPADPPAAWDSTMHISIGAVPGGYGWMFPKRDHLNIGVGGWLREGPQIRQRLEAVTRSYGFAPDHLQDIRGHHLPVRLNGSPVGDDTVLLVGDAAGTIDPVTGDGIYGAIRSGMIAADHVARRLGGDTSSDARAYHDDLERSLLGDLLAGRVLHDALHVAPGFCLSVLGRLPGIWEATSGVLRGEESYRLCQRRLGPLFGIVRLMAKFGGRPGK